MPRIFYATLLFLLATVGNTFGLFSFVAVFGLLGLVFFRNFWEIIIAALFVDLFYGTDTIRFLNFHFVITVVALFAFLVASIVRRFLRLPHS